jgi:hypothetical protein
MEISKNDTAIVFIDPQNEVLSEKGLAWGGYGARLISEINARGGHQMSLRLFISLQGSNGGISSPVAQY